MPDNHDVYNEKMRPLVEQLIEIAKEHNIPLVVCASTTLHEKPALTTTVIITKDVNPIQRRCVRQLKWCHEILDNDQWAHAKTARIIEYLYEDEDDSDAT